MARARSRNAYFYAVGQTAWLCDRIETNHGQVLPLGTLVQILKRYRGYEVVPVFIPLSARAETKPLARVISHVQAHHLTVYCPLVDGNLPSAACTGDRTDHEWEFDTDYDTRVWDAFLYHVCRQCGLRTHLLLTPDRTIGPGSLSLQEKAWLEVLRYRGGWE